MNFLIDECLHTSLIRLAHEAGHRCDHVNFLGLAGFKDWQLMTKIRAADYTFVTNNRSDFTALYKNQDVHAGLVIIIPNVTPSRQRELFRCGFTHVGTRDLTNTVLEVNLVDATVICREFSYP